MIWIRIFHRGLFPIFLLSVLLLQGGTFCYAAEETEEEKDAPRITREELRHAVMRFASGSSEEVDDVYYKLEVGFRTPEKRRTALVNNSAFLISSLDIALGPNPEVNLLDMVVLVTLSRIVVEEHWVPQVFGDEAKKLVEVFRSLEKEIWSIAAKVLTKGQQKELHDMIRQWRERNHDRVFVEATRFGDFAGIMGESELEKAQQSGGFLGVKGASRELGETRLLAERVMFYAQRMPGIARSTARLLLLDVAMTPEINQLLSDTGTLTKSVHQLAKLTEELPEQITEQRNATIEQVSKMLEQLPGQISEERTAAINQVMDRVAAEREAVIPQIVEVIDRAGAEGEDLVDHAFRRAVMLTVIFLIGSVLAMLIYRFVSERLFRPRQDRGT